MTDMPTRAANRRKPLEEGCTGSLNCPVDGHLSARHNQTGTYWSHIPLTAGQRKTLRERRAAANLDRILSTPEGKF